MRLPMSSYKLLSVLPVLACLRVDAGQATTSFSASTNPVYEGSSVTLTCSVNGGSSVGHGNSAPNDKFYVNIYRSTSRTQDFVRCDFSTITRSGLFAPATTSYDSRSLNVSFIANVTSAGRYECQVTTNGGPSDNGTALELKVYKAPSPPEIQPPNLTFNDSDPILINCTSTSGDPPAEIELEMTRNSSTIMNYIATSQTLVLLRLNASMELHDATVTCQVKNHQLPNMTAARNIKVNHILLKPGFNESQNALDSEVLNCSNLVDSFPPPVFAWSNLSASNLTTLASSESFGPVGYSGALTCNATNNVLQKTVVVTFYIKNGPTTKLSVTLSSSARMQTNESTAVTITSTTKSSSGTPAKTSYGTATVIVTPRPSSTQGSSVSTSVTRSVSNNTESSQNNEPIIIGVAVSVSLCSAAVVITIFILRYCRMRTQPPRNLPASQSTSNIIGENQQSENQGDDAEDIVCMTDNDLYGSNPPLCATNKSSIIYDEPYKRPLVYSTPLYKSQVKDSHGLSIRPQECDVMAQHDMDDRSAVSSQSEALEVHRESSVAMSEGPYSTPLEISATPIGTAASVRATDPPCDQPVSQQCFTKGKPSQNKGFENMAYMDIQLANRNAPEDFSPQDD